MTCIKCVRNFNFLYTNFNFLDQKELNKFIERILESTTSSAFPYYKKKSSSFNDAFPRFFRPSTFPPRFQSRISWIFLTLRFRIISEQIWRGIRRGRLDRLRAYVRFRTRRSAIKRWSRARDIAYAVDGCRSVGLICAHLACQCLAGASARRYESSENTWLRGFNIPQTFTTDIPEIAEGSYTNTALRGINAPNVAIIKRCLSYQVSFRQRLTVWNLIALRAAISDPLSEENAFADLREVNPKENFIMSSLQIITSKKCRSLHSISLAYSKSGLFGLQFNLSWTSNSIIWVLKC